MQEKFLRIIENMNLKELRIVAKHAGVSSPTTLTRRKIIDEFFGIAHGAILPTYEQGKKIELPPDMESLVLELRRLNRIQVSEKNRAGVRDISENPLLQGQFELTEGYLFRTEDGTGVYNERFEKLVDLPASVRVADGTFVGVGMRCGVNEILHTDRVHLRATVAEKEKMPPELRSVRYAKMPIREGGVTAVRGLHATAAANGILDALSADSVFIVGLGFVEPYGYDVAASGVSVGEVGQKGEDYCRFVAARAGVEAQAGKRVILVAQSEDGTDGLVKSFLSVCRCSVGGGSVTYLHLSGNGEGETEIVTDGLGKLYPPVDWTKSSSRFAEKTNDSIYSDIKSRVSGLTAVEAWHQVYGNGEER